MANAISTASGVLKNLCLFATSWILLLDQKVLGMKLREGKSKCQKISFDLFSNY